ncbi:putative tail protein [Xylophilus phage Lumi]|nr:putative tail protein [Xylophilus phage Lumi]
MDLVAEGYVELFQITLRAPNGSLSVLYLTDKVDRTWQGIHWEGFGYSITGDFNDSSGEQSKPTFSVVNPEGVFSKYAHQKYTDNAEVIRYRVLKPHIDSDLNSFIKNTWRINKIVALGHDVASFELRGVLAGQNFKIPGRAFYAPEFPQVSLS